MRLDALRHSAPRPAAVALPGMAGIGDGYLPAREAELQRMGERLVPHVPRNHRSQREDLAVTRAIDVKPEPSMNVGIADPESVRVDHSVSTVVDRLSVLVKRTEVAVAGEEVRVALRLRVPADVLPASEQRSFPSFRRSGVARPGCLRLGRDARGVAAHPAGSGRG